MTNQIEELKQYALMCANEIKKTDGDDHIKVKEAYERAKQFKSFICPNCWVRNFFEESLTVEAIANNDNIYKCEVCSFKCILPK